MPKHASSTRFIPYNPRLVPIARELRKNATPAERKLLLEYIRGNQLRFYFQRPIDHFIVDFYCPSKSLVIEIDGDVHALDDAEEKDAARTKILESYGLRVLRYTNRDILEHVDDVIREIEVLCGDDLE